jgi:hypothetical protein
MSCAAAGAIAAAIAVEIAKPSRVLTAVFIFSSRIRLAAAILRRSGRHLPAQVAELCSVIAIAASFCFLLGGGSDRRNVQSPNAGMVPQ